MALSKKEAQQGTEVAAPAPPSTTRAKAKKPAHEPSLVVQHNLSAGNLEHAHKLGGLAAPSLAVVHKDHGMNNFGEISLLAHHSLIDPKYTPVFDADIYSPRYPSARWKVNEKPLKQFKQWLQPYAEHMGVGDRLYNVTDKINERGHMGVLEDYDAARAMKLAFLKEHGVQVPQQFREKQLERPYAAMPAFQEYVKQHGFKEPDWESPEHRALSEAARKAVDEYADAKHAQVAAEHPDDPEFADGIKDSLREAHLGRNFDEDTGLHSFGGMRGLLRDAQNGGKTEIDSYAMQNAVDEQMKSFPNGEFEAWAKPKLQPMEGEIYMPKGQRKMRYDLDSVLKEVTRKVRGGEGFNYGLGSARSHGAKKFRDIAGLIKDKNKLVTHEEFEAAKKKNDDEFGQLADQIAPYHATGGGFGTMDALVGAIGDSYKRGKWLGATLRENAFNNVPPHLVQKLGEFAQRLRETPTEYFEAKPQRAVDLSEFRAAVVPHDVSQRALDILKQHGIHHVERYQRNGTDQDALERKAAVERAARAHDLLLSEKEVVFDDLAKAEDEPGVAIVMAYNDQGELLLGRRKDNERWTPPAGHLNPGEAPRDGAERELREETGLRATSMSFLKEYTTSTGVKLYCFTAYVHGEPHSNFDPDDEVSEWKFVDVSDGLPSQFFNKLHGPKPESGDNLVTNVYDIAKAEVPAENIGKTSADENGVHFETGHPVTVKFVRGTTPAPHFGELYQQHIEPAGRYMIHNPTPGDLPRGWEAGEVHFKNPLVLHFNTSGEVRYDDGSWKARLHRAHGAGGKALSRKLAKLGHDGIVTVDGDNTTREIVDLTSFHKDEEDLEAQELQKMQTPTTFPNLGVSDNRRETPIVNTAKELKSKKLAMVGYATRDFEQKHPGKYPSGVVRRAAERAEAKSNPVGSVVTSPGSATGYSLGTALRSKRPTVKKQPLLAMAYLHGNAPIATKQHEDFHMMMNRVEALHGHEFRRRLAYKLFQSIPAEHRQHVVEWAKPHKYDPASPHYFEEHLALMHNYLNNPGERSAFHILKFKDDNLENPKIRAFDVGMKKAFRHVQQTAATIKPEDVIPLGKSEDDEVARLLNHPDPIERKMALDLDTVKTQHVLDAALDPEPSVHQAAIDHPLFGETEGHILLDANEGHDGEHPFAQQLYFLSKPERVTAGHLSNIIRNAGASAPAVRDGILDAVVQHPSLSDVNARMIYRGFGAGHAHRRALMDHASTPGDVLEHAVNAALLFPSDDSLVVAKKAVKHPNLSPEARASFAQIGDDPSAHALDVATAALAGGPVPDGASESLHMARLLRPASNAHALLGAFLRGPSATKEDIDRALQSPHHAVWMGALRSPVLQPEHMDQLVAQAQAAGDRDALQRMMDHPHFGNRHLAMLVGASVQKSEVERLRKMAIADIPKGAPVTPGSRKLDYTPKGPTYSYDHVLKPEHRAAGYSLQVEEATEGPEAQLFHHGKNVGSVYGARSTHTISPHSELDGAHQGQGLGRAMYEALYSHALHSGVQYVRGGPHSQAASLVHESLARRHGLNYVPEWTGDDDDDEPAEPGPYGYALKSEGGVKAECLGGNLLSDEDLLEVQDGQAGDRVLQEAQRPPVARSVLQGLRSRVRQEQAPDAQRGDQLQAASELQKQARPESSASHRSEDGQVLHGLQGSLPAGVHGLRSSRSFAKSAAGDVDGASGLLLGDGAGGGRQVRPRLRQLSSHSYAVSGPIHPEHHIAAAYQLGFDPSMHRSFQAARFLAGGADVGLSAMRRALYVEDGDHEAAALRAHGFEVNDKNRAALRSVQSLRDLGKIEDVEPNAQEIYASQPEGQDVAEAVRRAFEQHFVLRVKLGGKHSSGSMLAHDTETGITWLLKSGSGGAGVAAGADQDPSNPNAREAAWYHIAKAWGVDRSYPRAEEILIDGHPYAALHMLPWSYKPLEKRREKDPGIARRVLAPYLASGLVHQWAAMDFVFGNPDSHGENVMSEDPQDVHERRHHTQGPIEHVQKDEDVKLIDHGSAFAGSAFDPAHDKSSFVPYCLRAWGPHVNFNALPAEEKLRMMPRVDRATADRLKAWFQGVDFEKAAEICERYGINVGPQRARHDVLLKLADVYPFDEAVNRLWATT